MVNDALSSYVLHVYIVFHRVIPTTIGHFFSFQVYYDSILTDKKKIPLVLAHRTQFKGLSDRKPTSKKTVKSPVTSQVKYAIQDQF